MKIVTFLIAVLIINITSLQAKVTELYKLNVSGGIKSGIIQVQSNTPFDIGKIENIFDGQTSTLARTPAVNPLIITLILDDSIAFAKTRIFFSYGEGTFRLEAAMSLSDLSSQGPTYKVIEDEHSLKWDGWDSTEFEPVPAKVIRLTVRRTTGDNYVHLNEWEIYQSVSLAYLAVNPNSIEMHPAWQKTITKVSAATDSGFIQIDKSKVKFSSSDSNIVMVDDSGKVIAFSPGSATITAEYRTLKGECKVKVTPGSRSIDTGDLDIRLIHRSPEINYVWGSWNPATEGWPEAGSTVTWQAEIRNWSKNERKSVSFKWKLDSQIVHSGSFDISSFGTSIVEFPWK
ncbi:MAG: Ig-like domain-containing protein, partial [Bacteroidota bacterium]